MGSRAASIRSWVGKHEIAVFLVVAYALSWSIWPLVLLNPASSPMMPFGPGLAALLVTLLVGGRVGLGALGRQLGKWRVSPGWYALALGLPLVVSAAAFGAVRLSGAQAPLQFDPAQVVTTLLTTLILVGLFEELGWRGFLLPRLQKDRPALAAALITGLVWLPWHLPEFVSDPGQRPLVPFAIIVLALSVILAWLYNSTGGSLPIVMLFHAAHNAFVQAFVSGVPESHYQLVWWVLAGGMALVAVIASWYAGGRSLARDHRIVGTKHVHPQQARPRA